MYLGSIFRTKPEGKNRIQACLGHCDIFIPFSESCDLLLGGEKKLAKQDLFLGEFSLVEYSECKAPSLQVNRDLGRFRSFPG